MSASSACRATIDQKTAGRSKRPAVFFEGLMPDQFILESQLFLFQPVEQGIVGVGAVLFKFDLRMERRML